MSSKKRKQKRANMSEAERKQRAFIRFLEGNGMDAIATEEKRDLLDKISIRELMKEIKNEKRD